MRNSRDERGVIVVVLVIILIITAVLAALLGMHRQRAPMAANTLKRTQAYYYAEAALYEAFNRFRNNEWNPVTWADTGVEPMIPAAYLVGGHPAVSFITPLGDTVPVFIRCRRAIVGNPNSKLIVDATYDYSSLSLRTK